MEENIQETSHRFFERYILPFLEAEFPEVTQQTAFGIFGLGSEAYGMDDALSRDHHWGLRIDALLPEALLQRHQADMTASLAAQLPSEFEGHSLREGHVQGMGVAFESREGFLRRSIGLEQAPVSDTEWLGIPEEEIIHVINGEVWRDESGAFTRLRTTFNAYYPENVRRRRLAHWCRYFSGMGTYALKRALLRDNFFYATTAFAKAIRWGVQIAFLLEKQYFPYDKWLMAYFERLPRLHTPLRPLVDEAVQLTTSWERKLEILHAMADVLDAEMVAQGLIAPHPRYRESPSSGYRLLEHAYAEMVQGLPVEIKGVVPQWEQVFLERFHALYVDTLPMEAWDGLLRLSPEESL